MSQPAVYLLLFLSLALPVPGALAIRLLGRRLGDRALLGGAAALFAVAIVSALALARADASLLRVGDLTLLVPATQRGDAVDLPPDLAAPADGAAPPEAGPPDLPTLTPRPSATPRPSPTPEATATATPEPPSPTPEPPAGPRRYTVQPGDTFRAIAERYGVSVADLLRANGLTPEQADSLRPGQELVIP